MLVVVWVGLATFQGAALVLLALGHRWLLPLAVVWVIAGVIGGALAVIASLYIDAMVLPRGDPGSFLDEVLTVATEQAVAGAIYGAATGVVLAIIAHRTASS